LFCILSGEASAQQHIVLPFSLPEKVQFPIPERIADNWMKNAARYSIYSEKELALRIACYERAIPLYRQAQNRLKEAGALQILGDCLNHKGALDPAETALLQALSIYKELKYSGLQGVYDLLGNVNSQRADYNEALKYGLLAVKTAESEQDSSLQLCTIYNRLGLTLYHLADYNKALIYFKKSLHIAGRWQDTASVLTLVPNIASTYWHMGHPKAAISLLKDIEERYPLVFAEDRITFAAGLCDSYVSLGQYEQAGAYVRKLQSLSALFDADNYIQDVVYKALLNYFQAVRDYERLRYYARTYEAYCKRGGYAYELLNDYGYLFRADSALGEPFAAMGHYQQYKLLQDSLFTEKKSHQIAQMQMQFETESKDRDLLLKERSIQLLTRKALLQRSELERAHLEGNVIIGGTIMLILILVLGYNRYRLKQKINHDLTLQQQEISQQHTSLNVLLYRQQKLVAEKEWLIRKIHHRVENNLQIIVRLLNTQAANLDDGSAQAAIRESRHRMQAVSLIHQKLYQSDNKDVIDMDIYIRELVVYFKDSFAGLQQIAFDLQLVNVYLEVYQAVPIGLILNEAITNAFKYAFAAGQEGVITVELNYMAEDYLRLSVMDNGKGLPADFERRKRASMGMALMDTLTEQLEGNLSVINRDGVTIVLVFKPQHHRDTVPGLLKLVDKTA
jgi:two-component sensor histidine kinase